MSQDASAPARVVATPEALGFIEEIRAEHPEILFHQSGGCCDGSSPMCFRSDDFKIGEHDVCLGEVGGVRVYMNPEQFEAWKHTQLILDVVPGAGGMFSLDNGRGKRFHIRSRAFSEHELAVFE